MADETKEAETSLEIELASSRWKHFAWGVIGIGVGLFVGIHMGSIGWVIGGIVALGGVNAAWAFAKTLMHPPGTIVLRDGELIVPAGVSTGDSNKLTPAEVKNAYVLRRALPWNQSGPILVIETKRGVFELPREWFEGEGDQRRVAAALNRRLGRIP
jgi:hypothetical protein